MKNEIINLLRKETSLSEKELESLLEIPPSPALGDFAFPCFVLSKKLKKNPNEIAQSLAEKIPKKGFEKVEAKGPYLNFFVDKNTLAEKTLSEILKKKEKYGSLDTGKGKTVMIEFSQPNTHKAFHIGHVRGTSLGESLSRILEYSGTKVIRANYMGDTGMHIAKWIWCYEKYHSNEKLKDDESWIADIYVDSIKKLKEHPEFQEEANEINRKLEDKSDKKLKKLWEKTRKLSLDAFERIYKEFDTKFDKYFFESEVEIEGKKISKELVRKRIAKISEEATIVDLKKYNLGVWVLLRSDGTALYSAKDLALAKRKFDEFKLDKSIYIVGNAQKLHFYQLFKTLELMKFGNQDKFKYIPVMEVRFPWGKMSSRTGDNILYSNFKGELMKEVKKQLEKKEKLSEQNLEKRALAITISALKYSMLKQDVSKNFIFNKDEAMKFEGNTGPYLLYTYARAKSILRKAKSKKFKLEIPKLDETEKKLISQLSSFPEIVNKVQESFAPNLIANYAYVLAQSFNEFYHSHQVIGSENENFLLALVETSSQVLKNALNLLGIEVLEKM